MAFLLDTSILARSHLLTFNTNHFATLATVMPGLLVVDPAMV
jgi:hypothetical protein